MASRVFLKYPRTWTETRHILKSLDLRWNDSTKIQDKHRRLKVWVAIARDANAFFQAAKDHEKTAQIAVEYVRDHESFVKLMVETVNLNFHRKNIKAIETWMRSKKIPIQ